MNCLGNIVYKKPWTCKINKSSTSNNSAYRSSISRYYWLFVSMYMIDVINFTITCILKFIYTIWVSFTKISKQQHQLTSFIFKKTLIWWQYLTLTLNYSFFIWHYKKKINQCLNEIGNNNNACCNTIDSQSKTELE